MSSRSITGMWLHCQWRVFGRTRFGRGSISVDQFGDRWRPKSACPNDEWALRFDASRQVAAGIAIQMIVDGRQAVIRQTTIVGGSRVIHLRVDECHYPHSMTATITVDDGREWTFEEPGWLPLGFGVHERVIYFWSARHLLVLPDGRADNLNDRWFDEDILLVFAVPDDSWLLICETSVRLWDGAANEARVELGDVADDIRWESPVVTVRDQRGVLLRLREADGQLTD
jgi:hypothetical protein